MILKKIGKRILAITLVAFIICGCTAVPLETVKEYDNAEEIKALVSDFYSGVESNTAVKMLSDFYDSNVEFRRDGDKARYTASYETGDLIYYAFIDNGRKIIMYEGSEPVEDEQMYDITMETIANSVSMVKGIVDNADDTIKLSAATTQKGQDKTLEYKAETSEGTITVTGSKKDGKLVSVMLVENDDADPAFKLNFDYADYQVTVPEYTLPEPRVYNAVESPYKTIGDVAALYEDINDLHYTIDGDHVMSVPVKDGENYYQVSAVVDDESYLKLEALNFDADDYKEKAVEIVKDLPVTECLDFGAYILTDEQLSGYNGISVGELMNNGFESNGWSIWEEDSVIWVSRDMGVYEANIELPEGFDSEADFEFEDLYGAKIVNMKFSDFNPGEFPLH